MFDPRPPCSYCQEPTLIRRNGLRYCPAHARLYLRPFSGSESDGDTSPGVTGQHDGSSSAEER